MLRAILGLWLSQPPTISVDARALALPQAQAEQLHGELMSRLVEEGHAVGASGAVVVRLTGSGDTVHVEVQHGRSTRSRDVAGEGALLRLQTIHAAIELLAQVEAINVDPDPALASPRELAVALEISPGGEAYAPAAVRAIVETGHVVTPSPDDAKLKLCLTGDHEHANIQVVEIAKECSVGTPALDLDAAVATALTDAHRRTDVTAPPHRADDRPPAQPRAPARPSTTAALRPWSGAIGVGLGVQGRIQPVEPLVLLRGDARHRSGALIVIRTEITGARVQGSSFTDTFITGGGGWRFAARSWLHLEVALTAGVAVHGFAIDGDSDARADFTAELPLAIAFSLGDHVELGIAPLVGVSTRARRHIRGHEILWARDRWRIAALATLTIPLSRKLSGSK